jgi:Archaeal fructose-1,6-bisphosphatase and related enzymes of inositol monophosphatase family
MCADPGFPGQAKSEPLSEQLSQPLLRELEELAVSAAGAAGRFIVQDRPRGLGVLDTKTSVNDIVTVMDQQSEELLRAHLLSARPERFWVRRTGALREPRVSPGSLTRLTEL